ncbi:MAG TPA: hypothetical protein PK324_07860 [Nocardioides sp.]|nr:hypothetical protein [Nocardioides sp.]
MTRTLLVAATLIITAAAPARAGWRPLELMVIDAGQGGAAGKRCVDRVAAYFKAQGEDVDLTRRDLAAVRAKLPATLPTSVLAWTDAETAALRTRKGDDPLDAIVVIDCRPDVRTFDVVIDPTPAGVTTLRLRAVALDARVLDWLARQIQIAAYTGFEL